MDQAKSINFNQLRTILINQKFLQWFRIHDFLLWAGRYSYVLYSETTPSSKGDLQAAGENRLLPLPLYINESWFPSLVICCLYRVLRFDPCDLYIVSLPLKLTALTPPFIPINYSIQQYWLQTTCFSVPPSCSISELKCYQPLTNFPHWVTVVTWGLTPVIYPLIPFVWSWLA